MALCRFHSSHVALRKPILAVYSGLFLFPPNPLLFPRRNQGYRGRRLRNQIQCFDLDNHELYNSSLKQVRPINRLNILTVHWNRSNCIIRRLLNLVCRECFISDIWLTVWCRITYVRRYTLEWLCSGYCEKFPGRQWSWALTYINFDLKSMQAYACFPGGR